VFRGEGGFYYVVLAVLAGVYLLCRAIVASRFGRVLRGTRENAVRMAAIGFDPFRYQLVAYVIAAMIAGVAGVLLANQAEFVSPAYMTWQRSGELIFMVVLGGHGIAPRCGAWVRRAFLLPGRISRGLDRALEDDLFVRC
jgi:branched-chain amino acid transport system permease protein